MAHALEHWDSAVLPDFTRWYGVDTSCEDDLLNKPWWWLRHHILALFGVPESFTASQYRLDHPKD